jgi:hypothetical protein
LIEDWILAYKEYHETYALTSFRREKMVLIGRLCRERGLTLQDLASGVGVSRQRVYQILGGKDDEPTELGEGDTSVAEDSSRTDHGCF